MSFSEVKAREFLAKSDYVVAEATKTSGQLKDISNYNEIAKEIENVVLNAVGTSAEVNFFGSRVIGVAHERSDLDIYVKIGAETYPLFVSTYSDHFIKFKKLERELQSRDKWKVVDTAVRTAVPVIFTRYLPMNLDCDINILNGLGTENSKLLAHLFEIQPEAVKLFHFVRLWLKAQGFDHFKGYLITLLVLFFLQNKGLMPSGEKVHQTKYPKVLIDGFEVQFDSSSQLCYYGLPAMRDYKQYVKGFFQFYKDLSYSNVMSTFHGSFVCLTMHQRLFPKFLAKGIYITGPCNRALNCGVVDYSHKNSFIALCKDSSNYLNSAAL